MFQTLTLAAGVAVEFQERADFFRLLAAPTTDVTVVFYDSGREISRAESIGAGYAEKTPAAFDRVRISSVGGGAVKLVLRLGSEVRYDTPPNGNVTVTNTAGAFTQSGLAVTAYPGVTLLPAKANRRYLLIQNNDLAIAIYVVLNGDVETLGSGGVKIAPGGSYELNSYVPTGAIMAVASSVNNLVVVVEG